MNPKVDELPKEPDLGIDPIAIDPIPDPAPVPFVESLVSLSPSLTVTVGSQGDLHLNVGAISGGGENKDWRIINLEPDLYTGMSSFPIWSPHEADDTVKTLNWIWLMGDVNNPGFGSDNSYLPIPIFRNAEVFDGYTFNLLIVQNAVDGYYPVGGWYPIWPYWYGSWEGFYRWPRAMANTGLHVFSSYGTPDNTTGPLHDTPVDYTTLYTVAWEEPDIHVVGDINENQMLISMPTFRSAPGATIILDALIDNVPAGDLNLANYRPEICHGVWDMVPMVMLDGNSPSIPYFNALVVDPEGIGSYVFDTWNGNESEIVSLKFDPLATATPNYAMEVTVLLPAGTSNDETIECDITLCPRGHVSAFDPNLLCTVGAVFHVGSSGGAGDWTHRYVDCYLDHAADDPITFDGGTISPNIVNVGAAASVTVRLEVVGSTLSAYVNDTLVAQGGWSGSTEFDATGSMGFGFHYGVQVTQYTLMRVDELKIYQI